MKLMKKILAVALTGVMALSMFTACSDSDSSLVECVNNELAKTSDVQVEYSADLSALAKKYDAVADQLAEIYDDENEQDLWDKWYDNGDGKYSENETTWLVEATQWNQLRVLLSDPAISMDDIGEDLKVKYANTVTVSGDEWNEDVAAAAAEEIALRILASKADIDELGFFYTIEDDVVTIVYVCG